MATDAELVQACKGGDRSAFGQIVDRYQSLVCAIAYSGTGDLALSQDLAQETFLAAWKGLEGLREPGKLKAWLSGIVRRLAISARRRRQPVGLDAAADAASKLPSPLDEVIGREQEAVLWRSLEAIPETYREPLVLFYRESRSVARVAEALELSEDAVKQRLSRGRQMLKEQVAALVESALERTRPGSALTVAILAALPAAAPQAAAAGVALTAAKGSGSAPGVASAALSGAVLGPLLGVAGAYLGGKASLDATRSPRERAFVKHSMVGYTFFALAFAVVEVVGLLALPRLFATVALQLVLVGAYTAGLVAMILRGNRRQIQIQIEDGTYVDPATLPRPDLSRMAPSAFYGSFAGTIFGGTVWMIPMSLIAGEPGVAALVFATALGLFLLCSRAAIREPKRYLRLSALSLVALALLNLAAVNLRWEAWMDVYRRHWTYEPLADLPVWAMNLGLVLLFGWLLLRLRREERMER